MKKTIYFLTLLIVAIPFVLKAQDTPPAGTPFLTMTVQPNSSFTFEVGRAGEGGPIWIDAGDGNYILKNVTYNWSEITITTLGEYVKVYGSLRNLYVVNQNVSHFDVTQMSELRYLDVEGNWITELDLSQNFLMENLYFNYNNLTEMDLRHCPRLSRFYARQNNLTKLLVSSEAYGLEFIWCDGNELSACGLDSLFQSLPDRSNSSYSDLFLEVNGEGGNPGNYTCNTSIANNKGWDAWKWVQSTVYEPIVGDGTGCYTSVSEIDDIQISVFPNPAESEINIFCKDAIQHVELINCLGQIVEKLENLNRQDVRIRLKQKHQPGIYFLKVYSNEGYTTQKIIIK